MIALLRRHWPEYALEALGLALFMLSACAFGTLLEHPASPVHRALPDALLRRSLMGLAMGSTAVAIVYSALGRRSGAHLNPCVTLTFLALGKVKPGDALFYVAAQFLGGFVGVHAASALLGSLLADPSVHYVATRPGSFGIGAAFAAELAISFVLMFVVLKSVSSPRLAPFTGLFAGALVATYITFEAPISGMSMNPARTVGSAVPAHAWTGWWIYFSAPLLGMLLAAAVHRRRAQVPADHCAKLRHLDCERCIFCGLDPTTSSIG